jgi:hypothetical protein
MGLGRFRGALAMTITGGLAGGCAGMVGRYIRRARQSIGSRPWMTRHGIA